MGWTPPADRVSEDIKLQQMHSLLTEAVQAQRRVEHAASDPCVFLHDSIGVEHPQYKRGHTRRRALSARDVAKSNLELLIRQKSLFEGTGHLPFESRRAASFPVAKLRELQELIDPSRATRKHRKTPADEVTVVTSSTEKIVSICESILSERCRRMLLIATVSNPLIEGLLGHQSTRHIRLLVVYANPAEDFFSTRIPHESSLNEHFEYEEIRFTEVRSLCARLMSGDALSWEVLCDLARRNEHHSKDSLSVVGNCTFLYEDADSGALLDCILGTNTESAEQEETQHPWKDRMVGFCRACTGCCTGLLRSTPVFITMQVLCQALQTLINAHLSFAGQHTVTVAELSLWRKLSNDFQDRSPSFKGLERLSCFTENEAVVGGLQLICSNLLALPAEQSLCGTVSPQVRESIQRAAQIHLPNIRDLKKSALRDARLRKGLEGWSWLIRDHPMFWGTLANEKTDGDCTTDDKGVPACDVSSPALEEALQFFGSPLKSVLDRLPRGSKVHLVIQTGSKLYGLDTAESDVDFFVVFAAPNSSLLRSLSTKWSNEVVESRHGPEETVEGVAMEVRKFCDLLAHSTPKVVEVIFATSALFASAEFQALQAVRERFLTEELIGQYRGWLHTFWSRINNFRDGTPKERKAMYHYMHKLQVLRMLYEEKQFQAKVTGDVKEEIMRVRRGELDRNQLQTLLAEQVALLTALNQTSLSRKWRFFESTESLLVNDWLLYVRQRMKETSDGKHV